MRRGGCAAGRALGALAVGALAVGRAAAQEAGPAGNATVAGPAGNATVAGPAGNATEGGGVGEGALDAILAQVDFPTLATDPSQLIALLPEIGLSFECQGAVIGIGTTCLPLIQTVATGLLQNPTIANLVNSYTQGWSTALAHLPSPRPAACPFLSRARACPPPPPCPALSRRRYGPYGFATLAIAADASSLPLQGMDADTLFEAGDDGSNVTTADALNAITQGRGAAMAGGAQLPPEAIEALMNMILPDVQNLLPDKVDGQGVVSESCCQIIRPLVTEACLCSKETMGILYELLSQGGPPVTDINPYLVYAREFMEKLQCSAVDDLVVYPSDQCPAARRSSRRLLSF